MPYTGEFKGIEETQSRGGKKYHVATIGNDEFSVWDTKVVDQLQAVDAGTEITYEFKRSGNYKNLTEINVPGREATGDGRMTRQEYNAMMNRKTALKSATEIISGYTDLSLHEKASEALKTARRFETYINDGLDTDDAARALFEDFVLPDKKA